ncbi:MAG: hypothetical protein KGL39_22510 [Patescibacteria group bacterium]|nr:hypothetical protein [Patescibacteria group bacterium]
MSRWNPDEIRPAGPCDCRTIEPTENGQPRTLAEAVDHEALAYRAWNTPTGDFLAEAMERLAQLIRWTGATTPQEHQDRMGIWDDDVRRQWEDRGYTAGIEAGRREGRDRAFDEIMVVLKKAPLR